MKNIGPSAIAPAAMGLAATLLLFGCSGGGGSGGGQTGGSMYIQTCSLGCSSGQGGGQVSCSVVQIALNNEVSVIFSEPVDPTTVTSTTFQLIDVGSGQVPGGTRLIDPNDPRKVIFRPSISFSPQGTPIFGFTPFTTYRVTIPGTAHNDTGPFVRSLEGKANESRMECDIQTTDEVDDLIPGNPRVELFVDLAILSTPELDDFLADQPAAGAENVWRDSGVVFVFNDIMNPVTLANPITHQPSLISIVVDMDGILATPEDRATLFGNYVVSIDLNAIQTVMRFTPFNGMPSAGSLPVNQGSPRVILVNLPVGVEDLAGNSLANPGTVTFTPELIDYDPIIVPPPDGEHFTGTSRKDAANSSADWGQGRLTRGYAGGSGRLGALRVPTLQTIVLDTDGTLFKNLSAADPTTTLPIVATTGLVDNSRPDPTGGGGPETYDSLDSAAWPTVTVTDGIFEFSSINVEVGAVLQITGTNPARLYSRGPISIDGAVDIRGQPAEPQPSDEPFGGAGGGGGPNGGDGGKGGDRPDNTGNDDILALSPDAGIENVDAVINGGTGGGVGRNGIQAAGRGGRHHPNVLPTGTENTPAERGGLLYSDIFDECGIQQMASPGGGGGYATSGARGAPFAEFPNAINPAPPPTTVSALPTNTAAGGDAAILGLEPPDPPSAHFIRLLDPEAGHLRGGSGGGGGGTHLYSTFQEGVSSSFPGCYDTDVFLTGISHYRDHSAGGGGGGGGALQVVGGESFRLAGTILANGGDGGDNQSILGFTRASRAAPGGGGSGGAVRLQAKTLNVLGTLPGRIDVSGGIGGINMSPDFFGAPILLGRGGQAGTGLVRLEDISGGSNPAMTLMSRCSEASKILPFDPNHIDPNTTSGPCVGLPESESFVSVGPWTQPRKRPDVFTGAVSCWMRPNGDFFALAFDGDNLTDPQNPIFGWNMQVLYGAGTPTLVNYRGPDPNSPFGSGDFESNLGNQVNYLDAADPPGNQYGTGPFDPSAAGSYLAVRFQGALSVADVSANACSVRLSGVNSQIAPGSLTPWVQHPAELNEFLPMPNMIRFCVVFDRSLANPPTVPSLIQGVTNLIIRAQPD